MNQTDINKAANIWIKTFFSWEEKVDEGEVDCAKEGFIAGVNWATKRIKQDAENRFSAGRQDALNNVPPKDNNHHYVCGYQSAQKLNSP
jgi:hypothetical protein